MSIHIRGGQRKRHPGMHHNNCLWYDVFNNSMHGQRLRFTAMDYILSIWTLLSSTGWTMYSKFLFNQS